MLFKGAFCNLLTQNSYSPARKKNLNCFFNKIEILWQFFENFLSLFPITICVLYLTNTSMFIAKNMFFVRIDSYTCPTIFGKTFQAFLQKKKNLWQFFENFLSLFLSLFLSPFVSFIWPLHRCLLLKTCFSCELTLIHVLRHRETRFELFCQKKQFCDNFWIFQSCHSRIQILRTGVCFVVCAFPLFVFGILWK